MTLGQMRRPWNPDVGRGRYRRGLYTFFWRATPHPFFTTFDAPGRIQSCTRRMRSNTPLQALTLLNDPAFVEIAQAFAARIVRDCPDPAGDQVRLRRAFFLALARSPSPRELETLESLLANERRTGAQPAGEWLAVARVLLNVDEFQTRE
jgi:hypothetical protein